MFYKDVSTIFSVMFFRYVMQELVETERDYVKDLGLVVEVSVVWTFKLYIYGLTIIWWLICSIQNYAKNWKMVETLACGYSSESSSE